jgi:hypothetical protein
MSRYLLGIVTKYLQGRSPAQHLILNHPPEGTWALIEFYMYALFKSHEEATLSYKEHTLQCFHTFKDVFILS